MKLALYSDLHLEFLRDGWKPPALDVDVVILAGDISKHTHGIVWAAATFPGKPVIYVIGNHEFYGRHIGMIDEVRKTATRLGIYFLENNAIEIDGMRFLRTTLWSDFNLYGNSDDAMLAARQYIGDYSVIRGTSGFIKPQDTAEMHRKAAAWLEDELSNPFEGKTVVVTHFAPHLRSVAAEYEGGMMTPYFTVDMAPMMARHKIDLWAFGHTHGNVDFEAENGCRVVSNQRGYPREYAAGNGFRENLVIEV